MNRTLRSLALVTALVGALLSGLGKADAQPHPRWMVVKVAVDATTNAISFERRAASHPVHPTASLQGLLAQFDGAYVYARVTDDGAGNYACDALAGDNPNPTAAKIQPATDDYDAIATVAPGDFFICTGQITSEEEEGGLLYDEVAITGGGTGGDAHTGYLLASDAEIWSYRR